MTNGNDRQNSDNEEYERRLARLSGLLKKARQLKAESEAQSERMLQYIEELLQEMRDIG